MPHIIDNFKMNGVLDFDSLIFHLNENVTLGNITSRDDGDLRLYNYSNACAIERNWNGATRLARGLILDLKAQRVVALPLETFFNYGGEHDTHGRKGEGTVSYLEKMDGSCIFIWFYDGEWRTSTRGAFYSDQAILAWNIVHEKINTKMLDKNHTYICELIGSENKIVIDYGSELRLVLLAVNDNRNLRSNDAEVEFLQKEGITGFKFPRKFSFNNLVTASETAKDLPNTEEGLVVKYENGVRVKCKGHAYCHLHGIISNFTPMAVWRSLAEGGIKALDEYKALVPDELWTEYDEWCEIFLGNLELITTGVTDGYKSMKHLSDKDAGMFLAKSHNPYAKWYFSFKKYGGDMEKFLADDKIRKKLCNLFKPKNNILIDLSQKDVD